MAGWQFNEMDGAPGLWLFDNGNGSGGGIGKRGQSVAAEICVSIAVDSLETAVDAAAANGGAVITPSSEVPGYGRWALLRDSDGSTIAIWESARVLDPGGEVIIGQHAASWRKSNQPGARRCAPARGPAAYVAGGRLGGCSRHGCSRHGCVHQAHNRHIPLVVGG